MNKDDAIGLLASLLSPKEQQKLESKKQRKSKSSSPRTGVYQKRYQPFRIHHSEWSFISATVHIHTQLCMNCANEEIFTNNRVLFRYERIRTFKSTTKNEETLDVHETYQPRAGVSLPDYIPVQQVFEDTVNVAYCHSCTRPAWHRDDDLTHIKKETLLDYLDLPFQDETSPETEGLMLVSVDNSDEPKLMSNAELLSLIEKHQEDITNVQ